MEPRARIELASPIYRTGASPAMLAGPNAWSPETDLNSPPDLTEVAHRRLCFQGLEVSAGVEPAFRRYECRASPAMLTDLERATGVEPVWLEWHSRT